MKEHKIFLNALYPPLVFTILIWLVFLFQYLSGTELVQYSIYPRKLNGLAGILFAPLLHGNWQHLFSNTFPMLVLGTAVFYFYKEIAYEAIGWMYLSTGLWLWVIGRDAYHLGASGLIYALAAFLFTSGLLRRNRALLTISLLVVLFYGGLVWGVFPLNPEISWEGHLTGAVSGVVMAVFFRKHGPQNDIEKEIDDSDLDGIEPYWLEGSEEEKDMDEQQPRQVVFRYRYVKKQEEN